MSHIAFNPTPFQRGNLVRLETRLDLGATNLEFDMVDYDTPCGTVGCACGHGPSLGIARLRGERWGNYARRVFIGPNLPAYFWLFDSTWAGTDSTSRGAAARIRCALEHGIPENHWAQMCGRAPLSYTVKPRIEGPQITAGVRA